MPNSKHAIKVALSEAQRKALDEAVSGSVRQNASEYIRGLLAANVPNWPDDLPPARSGVARYNESRRKKS